MSNIATWSVLNVVNTVLHRIGVNHGNSVYIELLAAVNSASDREHMA